MSLLGYKYDSLFVSDILVISPSWTTYKPQVLFSQHKPHILQTSLENHWKLTPAILRKVSNLHIPESQNQRNDKCSPIKDKDQTGQMPSPILVFAGHTKEDCGAGCNLSLQGTRIYMYA